MKGAYPLGLKPVNQAFRTRARKLNVSSYLWPLLLSGGCAFITDSEFAERTKTGGGGHTAVDTSSDTGDPVDCEDPDTYYEDADGDGYGNPNVSVETCDPTEDFVANDEDCNDTNADINPETIWTVDLDGDGYGGDGEGVVSCDAPDGVVGIEGDCDDDDPEINPGATEDCATTTDDNCNDETNEVDATDCTDWYVDADEDGFGDGDPTCLCEADDTYTADELGDCDDADETINPDAEEVCGDGIDNDCDGGPGPCGLYGDLNLSDAEGELLGVASGGLAGGNLATATDATGDGNADLLVAAYNVQGNKGRVYVVDSAWTSSTDLSDFPSVTGETSNDRLGRSIGVADLDGDGVSDLIMGAPQYDTGLPYAVGGVYVLAGPISSDTTLSDAARLVGSTANGYMGRNVAGIDDFDGDGVGEMLVGCHGCSSGGSTSTGAAFLVPGLVTEDAGMSTVFSLKLGGVDSNDQTGFGVSGAGDLDGDGREDLLVGARYAGTPGKGAVFVVLSSGEWSGVTSLADADAVLRGTTGSHAGSVLASAGDVDGDGLDDFLVGAPVHSGDESDEGAAYLITDAGSADANLEDAATAKVLGGGEDQALGSALDGAGDLDGDGQADVLVGVPNGDGAAADGGEVWVFYGPMSSTLGSDDAGARIMGESAGDETGSSVVSLGDIDGDGNPDIAIGGPHYSASEANAGIVYIMLGGGW